jgi:hypothetical protein
LATAARAQEARPTPQAQRTPEETAKSIAARWKPLLGLSDVQTARFEAAALTAEKKTAEAKAAGSDSAKFHEAMVAIFRERKAAVEKILTPPQWQQYEAYMAKARKQATEKPASAAAPGKPPA